MNLPGFIGAHRIWSDNQGTDLGSLYICNSCIFPSFWRLLTMEAGAVYDSFACFWDPIPHIGLLCPDLIQKEVFNLTAA